MRRGPLRPRRVAVVSAAKAPSRRPNFAWLDPRDERGRSTLAQIAVGLLALVLLARFAAGIAAGFRAKGLTPGLDFLSNTAGFGISEARSFAESDSYWQAFRVGIENTVRVALLGILLATPAGGLVALGRLSGNPIAARLGAAYVEIFRNTPLLVQLIFWYQGVLLRLPALSDALTWSPDRWLGAGGGLGSAATAAGGSAPVWLALSQKGIALPRLVAGDGAVGLALELPVVERFSYAGGTVLSPEYAALLFGLTAYTAAFVAEVVRGGIQAVGSGQYEAGRALGLSEIRLMRHVVAPQALRIIVPPLTNQYLNLTKNSSLAIYIGYPDLFNISLTIGNQTGQFVVVTAMIMAVYLALSLSASLAMNVYGRRIRLVER